MHRVTYDKDAKANIHYFDTRQEAMKYANSIYKRTGFDASVFKGKSKTTGKIDYMVVEAHGLKPLKKEKFGLFGA